MNKNLLRQHFIIMLAACCLSGCTPKGEPRSPEADVDVTVNAFWEAASSPGWSHDAPAVRIRAARLQADPEAFEIYLNRLRAIQKDDRESRALAFMAGFIPDSQVREILRDRVLVADDALRLDILLSILRQEAWLEPALVKAVLDSTEDVDVIQLAVKLGDFGDSERWRPIYERLLHDPRPQVQELVTSPPIPGRPDEVHGQGLAAGDPRV
jgi:hypothetical protein